MQTRKGIVVKVELEAISIIDLLRHMKVTDCGDKARAARLRELYSYLRYATRAQTGLDPEE